uniref:Uncharacterized protein n=1 Tax=Anguilla anguilla TaxID=7936 RepID=A0A0E9VWE2_ANGAN
MLPWLSDYKIVFNFSSAITEKGGDCFPPVVWLYTDRCLSW